MRKKRVDHLKSLDVHEASEIVIRYILMTIRFMFGCSPLLKMTMRTPFKPSISFDILEMVPTSNWNGAAAQRKNVIINVQNFTAR